MMPAISKYRYYLRSILTLLTGFRKPWQVAGIFLGIVEAFPSQVTLRPVPLTFLVRSALDVWIIKETCLDNIYFKESTPRPDWNIIDVGAGLGDFTILAAATCTEGIVHAYEPDRASHALLQRNLQLNGLQNAVCYRERVSTRGMLSGTAAYGKEAVSRPFVAEHPGQDVHKVDLAQMVARLPSGKCDLLKVDCEGCEFNLLLQADATTLAKIRRIAVETHDGYAIRETTDLAAHLEEHGFRVKFQRNPVHSFLGLLYAEV